MTSEVLKPNIQELQKDAISLIEQISSLMHRASEAFSSDKVDDKYGQFQQQVVEEVKKVKNLELRMAIVAPMKAGKSTILNAVIGQDILPSRNTAMTTLPTEVVFNTKLLNPTLTLSSQIVSVFQETLEDLRHKIQTLGIETLKQTIAESPNYGDMERLLEKIKDIKEFTIPEKILEREEIQKTLTELNDIIRLCNQLGLSKDPLGELTEIPRIETPFGRLQKISQPQIVGKLVFVDTPGPNEAGENLKLSAVVAEQLRQSSMVLIVLDFTQLKTEAAEKVKKEVQKVIQLRGQENLYVLVNKIDQRDGDKDMNPQQVMQFVAAEFGIGNDDTDQVFEVSAKKAFVAANFIQELEQSPNIPVCEMKAAKKLADLEFGRKAKEELEKADRERLCSSAKEVWEESGFTSFLERAVNAILEQAAPRCIKGSLQISRNRLMELSDDVKLRSAAIEQNQKNIIEEIESLKADIGEIETRQELWNLQVNKIQNDFEVTLNAFLNIMNKIFSSTLRNSKLEIAIKSHLKPLSETDSYEFMQLETDTLTDYFLDYLCFYGVKITKFTSEQEARKAEQKVRDGLREFIEILIYKLVQYLEAIAGYFVDELGQEVNNFHGGITNILEQAQKKLQDKFNVVLVLQQPEFNKRVNIDVSNLGTIAVSEYKPAVTVQLHNFFVQLFHINSLIIEENFYYINLASYIPEANQIIKNAVEQLERECKRFLEEDFQQRTNQYLMDVKGYLANYQSNLEQAINDKNLVKEKFQQLKKTLDDFVLGTKKPLEKTQNLLELTNQLLGQ